MKRERGDASEHERTARFIPIGDIDLFNTGEQAQPTHRTEVRAHLRTVPGPPPPDGQERKDRALAGLEEGNAEVIAWLRAELNALWLRRWQEYDRGSRMLPYVTADDIYNLLHNSPTWGHKLEGPQFWRASVWRGGAFQKIQGMHVPSLRDKQHAALLQAWRPIE